MSRGTCSSWLMKTEDEYHPRSHLFKPIIDIEQMKTFRDALKVQTSQESSLCQLACKDSPLAIPHSLSVLM